MTGSDFPFRSQNCVDVGGHFGLRKKVDGGVKQNPIGQYHYNPSLLSLSAVLYGNTFGGHLTLEEIAATNDLL
jgi:hypothetical protein